MNKIIRIGQGFDSHRLVPDRDLILGGVKIPHMLGLAGHSDADVLTHAVIDSLLGAINHGDIGELFPDTKPKYKNISSLVLLTEVQNILEKNNWEINNIDITVICEKPKLKDYKLKIKESLSQALKITPELISLKAKTAEQMGALGREEGIAVLAVCLLNKKTVM